MPPAVTTGGATAPDRTPIDGSGPGRSGSAQCDRVPRRPDRRCPHGSGLRACGGRPILSISAAPPADWACHQVGPCHALIGSPGHQDLGDRRSGALDRSSSEVVSTSGESVVTVLNSQSSDSSCAEFAPQRGSLAREQVGGVWSSTIARCLSRPPGSARTRPGGAPAPARRDHRPSSGRSRIPLGRHEDLPVSVPCWRLHGGVDSLIARGPPLASGAAARVH